MMSDINIVVNDYLRAASLALAQLKRVLGRSEIVGWRSDGVSRTGCVNGVEYEFHGSGVYVKIESCGVEIEIEFGPGGEVGVFDSWRLWQWVMSNPGKYAGFDDHKVIGQELERLLEHGQLKFVEGGRLLSLTARQ